MDIIDCHMHVFPWIHGIRKGKLEERGEKLGYVRITGDGINRIERYLPPSFYHASSEPEVALEYMKDAGVSKAVLLQAPCYGNHNEFLSDVVKQYPHKFTAVALVDPRNPHDAVSKLKIAIKGLGLRGVKFEIPDTPFYPDEERYEIIWETILALEIPVVIDLGWGEGEYYFLLENIRTVLKNFPELKMCLAHLGVSRLWDPEQKYPFPVLQKTLSLTEEFPNLRFDIAGLPNATSFMGKGGEDYPYPRLQKVIEVACEKAETDRIMWGSDYPSVLMSCTYKQNVKILTEHCDFLSKADKSKIMAKNASHFFGIRTR
jgi:predicted TIM-barrel fold metal-dependent hydrolase